MHHQISQACVLLIAQHSSQDKLESLDQRVEYMHQLVENIIEDGSRASSRPRRSGSASPCASLQAGEQRQRDRSSQNTPQNGHMVLRNNATQSPSPEADGTGVEVEGIPALSTQSTLARDFAQHVAGLDPETSELLQTLGQIIENLQKQSPRDALASLDAAAGTPTTGESQQMPPIEVSVSLIRNDPGM